MVTRPHVLVTGGAGFVGSHTCKDLARSGYVPVTYDNLSTGARDAVRWGPFEAGALQDEAHLTEMMRRYAPVAVLHFAACTEAGESVRDPLRFYVNNVTGTLSLLRAMQATGTDRIVFSSTAAVYGSPEDVPISEDHPRRPVNPYGRSKLMVEEILSDAARAYGVRYTVLRYFNAAGADPEGQLSENHDPETHLIPLVLQAAYGQRPEIAIFGTDYDTPDGTCIRDYVHVSDLAVAHVLAVRRLLHNGTNLVANLGTGRGFSVREVIRTVEDVVRRSVRVREAERRPGDPAVLIANPETAQRELGWFPGRSTLIDHIVADASKNFCLDKGQHHHEPSKI